MESGGSRGVGVGPPPPPRVRAPNRTMFKKCKSATFQLDGATYTIVASPPDTSHTKDDSAAVIRSGTPAAENGQLPPGATSQGSFTILRRTGTRKGRGEMTNTSTTPSPPPSMAQQQPPLPPRVPPQHLPPRVSMREGVAEEEEEDDERAASLLRAEELPSIDSPEACDKAAIQLRCLLKQVRRGQVSADLLQENLQYAARVLEAVFADEAKREEGAGGGGGGRAGEPPSEGRPSTPGESGAAVGAAEEEGAAARRTAARAACPTRLSPHPSPPPPPRRPPPPPPMAPQVQQHQQPQHRMQKRQLRTPVWARSIYNN